MTPSSLVQYFRSFLVKLNMIESQIGQMYLGGKLGVPDTYSSSNICTRPDNVSFAVVIELKDHAAPTHSSTNVSLSSVNRPSDLIVLLRIPHRGFQL